MILEDELLIKTSDFSTIGNLPELLNSKTENDIKNYLSQGEKIYKEYFDYEGCSKKIIENL